MRRMKKIVRGFLVTALFLQTTVFRRQQRIKSFVDGYEGDRQSGAFVCGSVFGRLL